MLCTLFFFCRNKHINKIIQFPSETSCIYFIPNSLQVLKIYLSFIRFHFCVVIFLLRNNTRGRTVNYCSKYVSICKYTNEFTRTFLVITQNNHTNIHINMHLHTLFSLTMRLYI